MKFHQEVSYRWTCPLQTDWNKFFSYGRILKTTPKLIYSYGYNWNRSYIPRHKKSDLGKFTPTHYVQVLHRHAIKQLHIIITQNLTHSPVKIQFNPQKIATKGFSTDSVRFSCTLQHTKIYQNRSQDHQFWVDSYRLMAIRRFRWPSWTPFWKKLFWGSDFGKLLVCRKVHENPTESIEKLFVAFFLGLRLFFPYIYWTSSNYKAKVAELQLFWIVCGIIRATNAGRVLG